MRSLLFVLGVFLLTVITNCKNFNNDNYTVEYYVCPKIYSCQRERDMGVIGFDLDKKDFWASKLTCCFNYNDKGQDSVIELAYGTIHIKKELYDSLFELAPLNVNASELKTSIRALIIAKKNAEVIDSFFFDSYLNVQHAGRLFKIDKGTTSFFINRLPTELKENWMDSTTFY